MDTCAQWIGDGWGTLVWTQEIVKLKLRMFFMTISECIVCT